MNSHRLSLEVDEDSSSDLSDEDEQEAGEVLYKDMKESVLKNELSILVKTPTALQGISSHLISRIKCVIRAQTGAERLRSELIVLTVLLHCFGSVSLFP